MGYLERFKSIVKSSYDTGKKFCEYYDINYSYYRKATMDRRSTQSLSRWVQMFVVGYELGLMDGKAISEKTTATQCKCGGRCER